MRRKLLNFKRSSADEEPVRAEYGAPIDMTDEGSTPPGAGPDEQVLTTGSVFDAVLSQELLDPSTVLADPPPAPTAPVVSPVSGLDNVIVETEAERDWLRAEMSGPRGDSAQTIAPAGVQAGAGDRSVDRLFGAGSTAVVDPPAAMPQAQTPVTAMLPELGFWDRYDEATASAELFAVPPAAITAIVGALHVATPVADRCRASHWVSECDVYVLTSRPELVEDPSWKILKRPSDVVTLLDDGLSDFPLIVVDIPRELPTWIRPLTSRLRSGGVGLVRYVLDDDPSDEDLATWHGELGRPSVLDLVAAVPPARVLDLLDRGEPVASVGGMPITADLLMALRLSV